jgi:hypothetical protein
MIELASIATVVVLTYLVLQILGPRPQRILLSAQERIQYTKTIAGRFGAFVYIANVVGGITSLATVYVFFIGTTQLFGYFIFVCILSMLAAGYVTAKMTDALLANPTFKGRLDVSTPTAAAVTSLFWVERNTSVSKLIKLLTQTSLLAILWLEFATLTKLSVGLFGLHSVALQAFVMFAAVLFMFDFIVRNGLRGFLFADLLEFPLILIGICGLLIGIGVLAQGSAGFGASLLLASPKFPISWCIIFVAATLFLNSFLLLTSEAHWLRVWTMRDQVQTKTPASTATTAVVWLLLVAVGLVIPIMTSKVGLDAVIDIVKKLGNSSVLFSAGFWVAAIAAMFSTTDAQIYSFLVVSSFDTKSGNINEAPKFVASPLLSATFVALCFAAVYAIVEKSGYPFEPIVFFVFPVFLCAVPAFVQMICEGRASTAPISVSIVLYLLCGLGMILFPADRFPLSLAAPLMPALVSAAIFVRYAYAKLKGRSLWRER